MSLLWMHRICILETQDLGSALWKHKSSILEAQDLWSALRKHKICILEVQDLYCDQTRILILSCSLDKDLMNHTSQEWLNGVHVFTFHKVNFFLWKTYYFAWFLMDHTSQQWLNAALLDFSQTKANFLLKTLAFAWLLCVRKTKTPWSRASQSAETRIQDQPERGTRIVDSTGARIPPRAHT